MNSKPRNLVAKDLWSGKYKQRVVSVKKLYKRKPKNKKEAFLNQEELEISY